MIPRRFKTLIGLVALSISLYSCQSNSSQRSQPDTSHIKVNLESYPLFDDVALVDTHDIQTSLIQLKNKYNDFIDFYWGTIIQLDSPQAYTSEEFRFHFTHPDYRHLLDTVQQVYKNYQDIDKALTQLYKNIKYYDSSFKLPSKVMYINSYLQSPAFTWEDYLGIGFDMYFGENFWPYESENVRIPKFISRYNVRKNIPIAAAKVLYTNNYAMEIEDKNLLDLMIMNGKQMLFLSYVLPQYSMGDIFGYSDIQWQWCEDNEKMIYQFFTNNQLIYENNAVKIMRYIAPTPQSMGMPEEAPGRTAVYIGYKIMKQYQEKTGKSLSEILTDTTESQKILKLSQYKP